MIYTHNLTLPKSTSKEAPVLGVLSLTKGFIYKAEFEFPAGCAGLAHLVVVRGGAQLWPSTLGESFATDDYVISFDDSYLLASAPFELLLYGWNEDETYPHVLHIRVGLVTENMFIARFLPSAAYEEYQKMVAEQAALEEVARQAIIQNPFPWIKRPG